MDDIEEQPEKALSCIAVTLEGIVMEVMPVHSTKQFEPIDFTE
jgi:hypothetical protein